MFRAAFRGCVLGTCLLHTFVRQTGSLWTAPRTAQSLPSSAPPPNSKRAASIANFFRRKNRLCLQRKGYSISRTLHQRGTVADIIRGRGGAATSESTNQIAACDFHTFPQIKIFHTTEALFNPSKYYLRHVSVGMVSREAFINFVHQ